VATARERARDVSLLDALGARPGQVARLLCAEQAMVAVPAAAAGLLLGFVLGRLLIPSITLTPAATRPVPPVVVQIPWVPVAAIGVVVAAAPVVAALLAIPRTAATATRLRVEEQI
jgi:ABC-type antimicrobial peptide transport system permease subunit